MLLPGLSTPEPLSKELHSHPSPCGLPCSQRTLCAADVGQTALHEALKQGSLLPGAEAAAW